MLNAKYLRVFQHPRTIIQKIARKLSLIANNDEIISPKLAAMGATSLCIATLGEGPILTTVFTGQKWKFDKYCQSARISPSKNCHTQHEEAISRLWNLCTTVLKPVIHALQNKLPKTKETITLYKGLQAPNTHALHKIIEDLKQCLPPTWVWSSSLETAINEATPNKGKKGKLSFIDRRLLRKGHSDLVTNHVGMVLSYRTIAIPIADLTPTVTSDEFFVHFDQNRSREVQLAHAPSKKTQLLCPRLPPTPQPALTKIIDSDLWLAIMTNSNANTAGANIPHSRKPTNHDTTPHPKPSLVVEKLTLTQPKLTTISWNNPDDTPRYSRKSSTPQHKSRFPESHNGRLKSTTNTHITKN